MWDDFNTAVQAIDVAALDRAGLGDLAGEIGRTRAVLDGLEVRITAGLRRLGASEASAAETLRQRTGCSTREAKHRTRRAEALRRMPNVADALSSGRLTGEHASALARAAAETSPEAVDRDAGLLVEASSMPADAASSKARDWVRHRQTNDDLERLHQWQRRNRSLLFTAGEGGMIAGIAKFDRVSGAQFQNLVEALADRLYRADGGRDNPHSRTRAQCRHDALLMLVGLEPATPPPGIPRADSSGGSAPSSDSVDSTTADSARPSDPAVGREAGLDGSGVGGSDPAVGREAGNGRASPGLAVPRPTPLPEFASGGPTRGSSCPGAGSVPNSDMGDSGTGSSGSSGHRPVLEVAGHGNASPRLSTPHQELRPDPASCSLPGTAPDATRGTISGPSQVSSAGNSGSSARRSDLGESSVGGSARRSDSGESSVGGSAWRSDLGESSVGGSAWRSDLGDSRAGSGGSGPGDLRPVLEVAGHGRASPRLATSRQELLSDLAGCSPPGPGPGAGVGTISGPGPGPGAGVGTISGPGPGPGAGVGTISGSGPGPGAGVGTISGSGPGPGAGVGTISGSGPGPGAGVGTISGSGPGPGAGVGTISGSGPGPGAGVGTISGPGSGPGPGAGVGTISGPGSGPGPGAGVGTISGSGSGPGPGAGVGTISGSGSGPDAGVGTISGSGSGPDAGVGTIHGPGPGPGAGVGAIHGPGPGPGAGVGAIHGPGSGFSPSSSLGCTCGRGFGPKAQLCVVMDVPYLATNGERSRCEIPGVGAIARSELERLGCDPDIYGILFDQQGLPLYHGRKTRRVSPQQWRVLVARDKGCVICGAHPNWCQAHHVRYWRLGGPTDIDNLVLLCHAHHRWVHDNEITLRHGPKGWYAPTGRPPPGDITGRSARSLAPAR